MKSLDERLSFMKQLAKQFSNRVSNELAEGEFPYANFQDLIDSGYTTLTLPEEFGGKGISLYEFVRLQEQLAIGDGSTALGIGWHMGIVKNLGENRHWFEPTFTLVMEKVKDGALINSAATEPQTGSPTRGGKPVTTAMKKGDKWIINGRKSFTTLAPILNYFIVSASIENSATVGNFLISRHARGVSIEETWDSIAMSGTGSHDLLLDKVEIDEHLFVEELTPGDKKAAGWLLHIPACYLGIAQAAQNEAISFAMSYIPNSIDKPIIELPNIKNKIGEIELLLMNIRYFLYGVAKKWDDATSEERELMKPELSAVKHKVTNTAIEIVDMAMRIVGARSLSKTSPLQRYYRDVRAGLHNPPMDDMTIAELATRAIERIRN